MANWEFKCDKIFGIGSFSLDHNDPYLFVTTQWAGVCPGCASLYGGYRIAVAIVWSVILILSVMSDVSWLDPDVGRSMWYLFLSNWSLAMVVLDAITQAVIWTVYRCKKNKYPKLESGILKREKDTTSSIFFKIEWIFFNVALGSGIVSSLVDGIYVSHAMSKTNMLGLFLYAFNSVYLIFNLLVVGVPLRFFHFLHTTVYLSLFVTASAVVHYLYGQGVYPFVNWTDPVGLIMVVTPVLLFGVMAMWAALVLLSLLRRLLTRGFRERSVVRRFSGYYPYGEVTAVRW